MGISLGDQKCGRKLRKANKSVEMNGISGWLQLDMMLQNNLLKFLKFKFKKKLVKFRSIDKNSI